MYSVNGIALDNPGNGWELLAPSKPLSQLVKRRAQLLNTGHGAVSGIPGFFEPVTLTFVVRTPRAGLEALYALWVDDGVLSYTSTPGRVVPFEYASASYDGYGAADELVDLTVVVTLPGVFWRDLADTTATVTISAGSVLVPVWAGMSGEVDDAVVRVRGPVSGLQVRSRGAWVSYSPSLPSGSYLRFHSDTGDAFVTVTDTWTGGTDAVVDFDAPGDRFTIYPHFTDPTLRAGRVEVITATRGAGAQAQVRGRGAYLV